MKKSVSKANIAPRIVCVASWRLASVKPLANYEIEVVFNDDTHGYVDMKELIMSDNAGAFAGLKDKEIFNQAYLGYGVLTWPRDIVVCCEEKWSMCFSIT